MISCHIKGNVKHLYQRDEWLNMKRSELLLKKIPKQLPLFSLWLAVSHRDEFYGEQCTECLGWWTVIAELRLESHKIACCGIFFSLSFALQHGFDVLNSGHFASSIHAWTPIFSSWKDYASSSITILPIHTFHLWSTIALWFSGSRLHVPRAQNSLAVIVRKV